MLKSNMLAVQLSNTSGGMFGEYGTCMIRIVIVLVTMKHYL